MRSIDGPPAFVSHIGESRIRVRVGRTENRQRLAQLGFVMDEEQPSELMIQMPNREGVIQMISTLRDLGFAFSVGKGWGPAEIVEFYREQNLLVGDYKKISWRNSDEWTITEC